jgi:hypothetical protein
MLILKVLNYYYYEQIKKPYDLDHRTEMRHDLHPVLLLPPVILMGEIKSSKSNKLHSVTIQSVPCTPTTEFCSSQCPLVEFPDDDLERSEEIGDDYIEVRIHICFNFIVCYFQN